MSCSFVSSNGSHKARELSKDPNWALVNEKLEDKAYNAPWLISAFYHHEKPPFRRFVAAKIVNNLRKMAGLEFQVPQRARVFKKSKQTA